MVKRSIFGTAPFMGNPMNQVPFAVEFHDELDINHVIGCKKCKRKKKNGQQVGLPTVPLIDPQTPTI
jgi:hypothetical protein